MEPSARRRFQRIEAILNSVARQQAAAEARAKKIDMQSRARDRSHAARMERHEARMERYEARVAQMEARLDRRMDAIAKIIQTGMKLVVRIEARQAQTDVRLAEIGEKLDALVTVVDGIIRRPGASPS